MLRLSTPPLGRRDTDSIIAVVGGFAQINVELVRGEIERALDRGDTALRMN